MSPKRSLLTSRRHFLKSSVLTASPASLAPKPSLAALVPASDLQNESLADYVLHIRSTALEIAPKRIVSATTYNGQFPGPLLRFKEGKEAVVDVFNDTDTPEQLHWHGQQVPVDVDGRGRGYSIHPRALSSPHHFHPKPAGFLGRWRKLFP